MLTFAENRYTLLLMFTYVYSFTQAGNIMAMLNTKQAAEKLAVHPATIRRLVKSGQLKATVLNSVTTRSQLRIDENVLDAFIAGKQ